MQLIAKAPWLARFAVALRQSQPAMLRSKSLELAERAWESARLLKPEDAAFLYMTSMEDDPGEGIKETGPA